VNFGKILLTTIVGFVLTGNVYADIIDLGDVDNGGRAFALAAPRPSIVRPRNIAERTSTEGTFAEGLQKSAASLELRTVSMADSLTPFPFGELDLRRHYAASFAGSDGFFGSAYFDALKLGSVSKGDFFSMLFIVAVLAVYQLRRKQKYLQHPLVM